MPMTNAGNRFIYRLWAPIYDATVNRFFRPGRRRALAVLAPQPGERILLVGVGTGADLPLLPAGVTAVGLDLSPHMLARARRKLAQIPAAVSLVQADAQAALFPPACFDAAILNLILSVVPDGQAGLRTAVRAVRPGGRLVIFDKFQPDAEPVTVGRQVMNVFSTLLGTDITRRLGALRQDCPVVVTHDEPSRLGGLYRVVRLQKSP
ncbi:MAG: methyltransferase domain-containing protein [Anaerolineales bacterium]|nr:methyltransferase domain-containing protein [Anaerolineales bacterium]